jgi:thiol-disulfide isomerase/thioredoxin
MKRTFLLLFLSAASALAVTVGDTFDQVVAEKGAPVGTMDAGAVKILTYRDAIIKVRDGVVVSVRPPDKAPVVAARPAALAPPPLTHPPEEPGAYDTTYGGPAVWETDYATAVEQAKARKCHLLILFTGSDWCPWCQKMNREVYSKTQFAQYSHDKFVLLKLDYLRHSTPPYELELQNDQMQAKYNVNGFPMVVIVDTTGKELIRLDGYREGGPSNFIRSIQAFE